MTGCLNLFCRIFFCRRQQSEAMMLSFGCGGRVFRSESAIWGRLTETCYKGLRAN